MKNLPTLCNDSSFSVQFINSVSWTKAILPFTMKIIIKTFEFHASMRPMRSAEYQATIPLKFLIIIHNYANVQTINQSKSLPGFRVVMTSLDGINDRSIQTLLRGENDSKQLDEIQAIFSQVESLQLILKISATYRLVTVICQQQLTNLQPGCAESMISKQQCQSVFRGKLC